MTQIALEISDRLLSRVDELVEDGAYANRSAAIRAAVGDLVEREWRKRIDDAFAAGFAATRKPTTRWQRPPAWRSSRSKRSPGSPGGSPGRGLVG